MLFCSQGLVAQPLRMAFSSLGRQGGAEKTDALIYPFAELWNIVGAIVPLLIWQIKANLAADIPVHKET